MHEIQNDLSPPIVELQSIMQQGGSDTPLLHTWKIEKNTHCNLLLDTRYKKSYRHFSGRLEVMKKQVVER